MGPRLSAPPAVQAEGGTAVSPGAVSLVKEKHPANSIKNVSQNAGEDSVSSAIPSGRSGILRMGAGPSSPRTGRGPSPKAGSLQLGEAQGLAGCDPGCGDLWAPAMRR